MAKATATFGASRRVLQLLEEAAGRLAAGDFEGAEALTEEAGALARRGEPALVAVEAEVRAALIAGLCNLAAALFSRGGQDESVQHKEEVWQLAEEFEEVESRRTPLALRQTLKSHALAHVQASRAERGAAALQTARTLAGSLAEAAPSLQPEVRLALVVALGLEAAERAQAGYLEVARRDLQEAAAGAPGAWSAAPCRRAHYLRLLGRGLSSLAAGGLRALSLPLFELSARLAGGLATEAGEEACRTLFETALRIAESFASELILVGRSQQHARRHLEEARRFLKVAQAFAPLARTHAAELQALLTSIHQSARRLGLDA